MKIGIIGCGNMGQALLKGIIAQRYTNKSNILLSDKDKKRRDYLRSKFRVCVTASNSQLVKKCDLIVLAVKPQDARAVLREIASVGNKSAQAAQPRLIGKLLISICAGLKTGSLQRHLGKVAVVRVMPNMPAQISQGISAICSGKYTSARKKKLAKSLFSCIGEVIEVKEKWMDAVTAISGSGPAYFFYLVEMMILAAEQLGLPKQLAQRLALKTALGSTLLMEQSKQEPQTLRKRVSSPGGTTAAAFNLFREKGLGKTLISGFKAAAQRSKKLQK